MIIMTEQKAKLTVSLSRMAVEACRLQDPVFCEFLEETGRLLIAEECAIP
jgi:hypothetical protein